MEVQRYCYQQCSVYLSHSRIVSFVDWLMAGSSRKWAFYHSLITVSPLAKYELNFI